MQKLTIYDISRLAGVSVTTVSRVLNGSANVNQETREKVEDVIRRHGYVPKQAARSFVQRGLYAEGLMMDDIRHAYMAELAYAIDQELSKWRVNTIVCNIVDIEREFISQVDNLIEKRVNGVILMGSIFEQEICRITIERRYSGFPFVAVNGNFALPNVQEVMQDQFRGTLEAVRYLFQQGRRNIGWVFYNKSRSDQKKYAGFLEGMRECGLTAMRIQEANEKSLPEGKRATGLLMDAFPDTDAIIYSADILAVGGTHCLNQRGIPIPDRVAVIGFNNSSQARQCYPPFTSIDNNIAETGKAAARLIIQVLNKKDPENVMIPCHLAIRGSTEKVPQNQEGEMDS